MKTDTPRAAIFLILFLVSLSANAPMLAPYQFVADDYAQLTMTVAEWFARWGVWRIAGIELARELVAIHVYGIAVIMWHALNGYLFYLVARYAFGSQSFALFLAGLITAFPWGYQAIIWAAGSTVMGASTVLWIVIYVLLTFEPERTHSYFVAGGLAALSLLGLMFNEGIFFSLCVAGIIVYARPGLVRSARTAAIVISTAPLAGAMVWTTIYETTKPAMPFKAVEAIDIHSILSGVYYQYSNLEVFEVWFCQSLRGYALSTIGPILFGTSLVSLTAALILISLITRKWGRWERKTETVARPAMPPLALMACMLLLLLGATGIYALGGGYSLDSRKRYIIVPLLVMAAAAAFWGIKPRIAARLSASWPSAVAIGSICTVGCLTSFLMLSLWYHELKRVNALADVIAQNHLSGPVRVEWNPKLTDIWSHATRSWGDPIDGEPVHFALHSRGVDTATLDYDAPTTVIWDSNTQQWSVRR